MSEPLNSNTSSGADTHSLAELIQTWKDRRLGIIFLLGIASGYPWVLFGSAMTAWLAELGISRTAIGYLGAVAMVYALNFLWAPLVDRRAPGWLQTLGRRRGWLVLIQSGLLIVTLCLSRADPATNLTFVGLLMLSIAVLSATQDLVIDAYRVELIPRSDAARISYGSAMATAGWWTGYSLLGAVPFWAVGSVAGGWANVYIGLGLVWLVFISMIFWLAPMPEQAGRAPVVGKTLAQRLKTTIIAPLADFFRRNGLQLALGILLFALLFKVGEAFLGRMSIVFYKEVGFSDAEIGTYSKLLNWWVTIIFAILGSLINARFGIIRGLLIGGIAMAASNLMFAWLAQAGPIPWILSLAVVVDGFTAAMGTVAFVAFITSLTSHTFTATQYALLASIGNLGRTTLAAYSGKTVDLLGGNWSLFFILTALAVVPSLLILSWLLPRLRERYPHIVSSNGSN